MWLECRSALPASCSCLSIHSQQHSDARRWQDVGSDRRSATLECPAVLFDM